MTPNTASAVVEGKGLSRITGPEYGKCVLASWTRVPERFQKGPRGSEVLTRKTESVNPAALVAWAWPSLRSCLLTVAQGPFHGEFPCLQRAVEQPL